MSAKVEALIESANGWSEREFLALALEALDQAGISAATQRKVRALLPDVCDACDRLTDDYDGVCRTCADDLEQRPDDEINRQVDMRRGR